MNIGHLSANNEGLASALKNGGFDIQIDDDGDIYAEKDGVGAYARVLEGNGKYIQFFTQFRANPGMSSADKLMFAMKVCLDRKFPVTMTLTGDASGYRVIHHVYLKGGVPGEYVAKSMEQFFDSFGYLIEMHEEMFS